MKSRMLLLALAGGLLAAACSGSSSGGVASLETAAPTADDVAESSADEGATVVDEEQAMLGFAACMRDQGIDIEDPTVDSEGNVQFGSLRGAAQDPEADRETIRAAMGVCEENLEGVSLGRRGDVDITELQDTMVAFAACMRGNGYDMPDPDFTNSGPGQGDGSGEGGGGGPFGEIDRTDPDFIAAEEACRDILDGFRGPGAPRGGQGS